MNDTATTGSAGSDETGQQPHPGTPIGFPDIAPVEWIPTDRTPDDPENPNRALLMGANSTVPQLVANALNTGNKDAVDYALTNLLEAESEGMATAHNGAGRMYDSTYAAEFATPKFYALLNPAARGALVGAIQAANLGGPDETKAFLAELGASLDDSSVITEKPAVVGEIVAAIPPASLPFDSSSSHALDSLPAGSIVTKDTDGTIAVDHPETGKNGQSIPPGDLLELVPTGTVVSTLAGKSGSGAPLTAVAVSLPANEHRGIITVIETTLHRAVAGAWAWIVDEEKKVEQEVKKLEGEL